MGKYSRKDRLLSEPQWHMLHVLIESGSTPSTVISKLTGWSLATIKRVAKSDTYEQYLANKEIEKTSRDKKSKQTTRSIRALLPSKAVDPFTEAVQSLQAEYLEHSTALYEIMHQLEETVDRIENILISKKGWFK